MLDSSKLTNPVLDCFCFGGGFLVFFFLSTLNCSVKELVENAFNKEQQLSKDI